MSAYPSFFHFSFLRLMGLQPGSLDSAFLHKHLHMHHDKGAKSHQIRNNVPFHTTIAISCSKQWNLGFPNTTAISRTKVYQSMITKYHDHLMYQSTMAISCTKVPWPAHVPKYHGHLMCQSTVAISCAKVPWAAHVSKYHGHLMCQSTMASSCFKVPWPFHVLNYHRQLMCQSTMAITCAKAPWPFHVPRYHGHLMCQSTIAISCIKVPLPSHVSKYQGHLMYQSHLTYPSRLLQSTMTTSCSRACLKYHSKVPTQRWTVKDTP